MAIVQRNRISIASGPKTSSSMSNGLVAGVTQSKQILPCLFNPQNSSYRIKLHSHGAMPFRILAGCV